jgi:RNA polymerase sigma-70 factor (ECF subfamily)
MHDKEAETFIRKIKLGDKEAFSALFRSHYSRIFSFLYRLLKDREQAEEITQEVFFRLWINHASLDPLTPIDSYLFSIAKHASINLYKRFDVEQRYRESLEERDVADTDHNLNQMELQHLINLAIDRMPPQQQLVFRLSREQELLNEEIAQKLHISKRTVEKHISNSLKTLRAVIEKNYLLFFPIL